MHFAFGWCFWDLPALIVLVAIVVIFVVHTKKMKDREKEFSEELAKADADKVEIDTKGKA